MLAETVRDGAVRCHLCSHRCLISKGKTGICGIRANREGVLVSLVYDKIIATHVDPIEKKPLFHYFPGSLSYSIATVGCNFSCTFCQNHDISQWLRDMDTDHIPGEAIPPETLVDQARKTGCRTIAFTYTEPTIFAELALDVAREAERYGVHSIFVTNGYMTKEMIETFGPLIRAANVDLKAFRDDSYRRETGARLQPVLESIRNLHENGTWVEITTLVIPGFNDSPEELSDIAEFIAQVDRGIPWHISAFHPDYRMLDRSRTPIERLTDAYGIGKASGLKYVYAGNAPGNPMESTFCPACGACIISRTGYRLGTIRIENGRCAECGEAIGGRFES